MGNSNSVYVTDEEEGGVQSPLLVKHDGIVQPSAGFFSKLTFSWVGSLISRGYAEALNLDDLPPLSGSDCVEDSYLTFRNCLESSSNSAAKRVVVTPSQVARYLILTSWTDISWMALFCLLNTLASYAGPYLIDAFVQYLDGKKKNLSSSSSSSSYYPYLLVSSFFAAKLVECLMQMHSEFRVGVVGIRTKAVLMEGICNKVLTLSCVSRQRHTSGEMINLMSVDAERVGEFSVYMHDPWIIILQVTLALLILYRDLGLAWVAAFFATVLVMAVNYPLSSVLDKYQDRLMGSRDKRMKATSEVLKNMRVLKLQAWEMKFLSKIVELRENENGWLKRSLYAFAMTTSVFWIAPIFVSAITFGACMIIRVPLAPGKILSAIATFRILQDAISNLPGTVSMMVQTKVSLCRIASFLSLDDLDLGSIERVHRSEAAVEISEGNFSWVPSAEAAASSPSLKGINLRVEHGMKIAVCGGVGSGKSTLLSSILGEVPKVSGTLKMYGSKAYVPQSPWIHSGRIVDNILFGEKMDAKKYDAVLEACSLKKDFEMLPFGDQTIVGERGLNLSGGQKQRVQIARALYQDADIYVLDDPFSALDAHTRTHIFKESLLGLLGSKTVIYVTHQVEFLPAADVILVMKGGRIVEAGKYHEILKPGLEFVELVRAHDRALSAIDSTEAELNKHKKVVGDEEEEEEETLTLEEEKNNDDDSNTRPNRQIVQAEEREKTRVVGFSVYWEYLTAAYGGALVPLILFLQLLFQLLQIFSNYWMASATRSGSEAVVVEDGKTLIGVYVALAIGSSISILARSTLLMMAAYKTSFLLFTKLHSSLFRAPMSFFDTTPSGRILNRVSTDQSAVDMNTPLMVSRFAFSLISLLGTVVVVSLVVWQVFIIFIPIIAISIMYQRFYFPAARELFRLAGVTKAPVIQHFSETISGLTTIRSFDQESRFDEMNLKLINEFSRPRFFSCAARQWLCFRLDMLSAFLFACSLSFLIFLPGALVNPGRVQIGHPLEKLLFKTSR
ncbi:unnamed protein product [Cuscuta campestris]|uniref:ABC-type xenobiotic transporter n=1 Tax=Cuscuta campestris TaxID=132261 RepID=A0A484NM84_9ASTE|nr:unnamed protein product [Cuscuta campestris]